MLSVVGEVVTLALLPPRQTHPRTSRPRPPAKVRAKEKEKKKKDTEEELDPAHAVATVHPSPGLP